MKYRTGGRKKRIYYMFEEYAGPNVKSIDEFVNNINKEYYSSFQENYKERETEEIVAEYRRMFRSIHRISEDDWQVVDIGGGEGFEYNVFAAEMVPFRQFIHIEPDPGMHAQFLKTFAGDDRIVAINGFFDGASFAPDPSIGRILLLNSCLHHMIDVEVFFAELKRASKPGDLLIIGHEPNNDYGNGVWIGIGNLVSLFTTDFLLRQVKSLFGRKNQSTERWSEVNKRLLANGVLRKPMANLMLRRAIDYGVNNKSDYKRLGIPDEWNEGYWLPEDISRLLSPEFDRIYLRYYRHLGDRNQGPVGRAINRALSLFFASGGSNFIMCLQRT